MVTADSVRWEEEPFCRGPGIQDEEWGQAGQTESNHLGSNPGSDLDFNIYFAHA